ncbi:MAG: lipocalin-like domain-containing protein [Chitinophagaceae bacterium]
MTKTVTIIAVLVLANYAIAQTKENASFPLAGTWTLDAAQKILPDGKHVTDSSFGKDAKGILLIDASGRYYLQIFRPDRPKFASGTKNHASPEEYRSALLGISTHVGHIQINAASDQLIFHIDYAAYPNWDNTTQTRNYTLTGDALYYEVPAAPGETVAVSIWKRIKTK